MPVSLSGLNEPEAPLDPAGYYRTGADSRNASLISAERLSSRISNLRLALFAITSGLSLFLLYRDYGFPAAACLVLGGLGFTGLVLYHERLRKGISADTHLRDINLAGEARMQGKWRQFQDAGEEFSEEGHPYSADLDLFGKASLFQWICAAETRLGRERLAEVLKNPVLEAESIKRNQGVLRELALRPGWRQAFQAAGKDIIKTREDPESLSGWAEQGGVPILSGPVIMGIRLLGGIGPFLAVALAFAFKLPLLPVILLACNALLLLRFHGRAKPVIASLCLQRRNLDAYYAMLKGIEQADFKDSRLVEVIKDVKSGSNESSRNVKQLQSIADWLDVRQNPFIHVFLNLVLLWDLQWLAVFQTWKTRHGKSLRKWLACIAQLEAYSSLSIIPFENPAWGYPSFDSRENRGFKADGLAHPLLPVGSRVANDFRLDGKEVVILTGSNMSGKSTLQRAIGINLALAYAGAPVCASAMDLGLFRVFTSMRLKDDLDKGLSSFYAELLRIKTIVEASRGTANILFLIDEIFRGTNSADRIAGAREVLMQLAAKGAIGVVSTHDLELGRLEEDAPGRFRNLHFEEHFVAGEIRFDYRLRAGISTTRNALHLMRMVGLR